MCKRSVLLLVGTHCSRSAAGIEAAAANGDVIAPPEPSHSSAAHVPSDATKLVRKLERSAATSDEGAERARRLQQKASESFRGI